MNKQRHEFKVHRKDPVRIEKGHGLAINWRERIAVVIAANDGEWYCIGEWKNHSSSYIAAKTVAGHFPNIECRAESIREKPYSSTLYARIRRPEPNGYIAAEKGPSS